MDPNISPDPAVTAGADVAQALLLLTAKLDAIETRLAAVESGAPAAATPEPVANVVAASDEDPEDDKDDKDPPAMDAAAVAAAVASALTAERVRAKGVEQAKVATRGVLGDVIAMDSASEIYREALKRSGVDLTQVAAGTELVAWTALQSVSASPAHAQDGRTAEKPAFDTSRIRNLGR